MRHFIVALLLVALAAPAFAGEYKFVPGTQVIATVILKADANGELTIVVAGQTITIGTVTMIPIVPKDPTDPKQNPTDPLAVKVAALVVSAPMAANERRTVSELYTRIGEFTTTEADELRRGVTFLFGLLPLPVEWKTWKGTVDSFAEPLGVDDVRRAWKLIGEGLVK